MINRTYSELITLPTFEERFKYLRLESTIGAYTFGFDRYLNQVLYRSDEWKRLRDEIIIRDNGCDLACEGYSVPSRILVHHLDPITKEDVLNRAPKIFDPENLVVVSHRTHNAIHYGDESIIPRGPIERKPNDTCPWRR